jgi:hypothetical protein
MASIALLVPFTFVGGARKYLAALSQAIADLFAVVGMGNQVACVVLGTLMWLRGRML